MLELIAAVYLYANPVGGQSQNPFIISTSSSTTTTTTRPTSTTHHDKLTVESAIIFNDTLSLQVQNQGPSEAQSLKILNICTPGFLACYDYKKEAGIYYSGKFFLPSGKTFIDNLTGVCFMPIYGCKSYLPVGNATYSFIISFGYTDGASVVVPITALANNTWSMRPTAILGVSASLTIYPDNLTGLLNATVTANGSLPYDSWRTLLNGYLKPGSLPSGRILTNSTGCGRNYTGDCSGPVNVLQRFYTVTTGAIPGVYYAVIVRDTTDIDNMTGAPDFDSGPAWAFALWVLAGTAAVTTTK